MKTEPEIPDSGSCSASTGHEDPAEAIKHSPAQPQGTHRPAQHSQDRTWPEQVALLRTLDAAANRAGEGLRVVEDYVRFALDDRHLTSLCKQLRHDLASVLGGFSTLERLAARETGADVGTDLSTATEQRRLQAADVLTANFKRIQQSLRSLEEHAKVLDPAVAGQLEQLRYRAYTLERVVGIGGHSLECLAGARLCVLVDGGRTVEQFRALIESLLGVGVSMLQLRDKKLADRQLVGRGRLMQHLAGGSGARGARALTIINDRPDLAALVKADGVHLGQEDHSVKDARSIVGPSALIGVSTHSLDQARQAVLDGANYLGVGPTFPSQTKQFAEFPGVELLRQVGAEIHLPAFAIGGIGLHNVDEVLTAGFTRIAVGSAVTAAADPAAAARQLLSRLTTLRA